MSMRFTAFVALAALISACSAAAQDDAAIAMQVASEPVGVTSPNVAASVSSSSANADIAVTCDVRSRRTPTGMLIQASAFSDHDMQGEYDLRITKSGGGNSSEITQSGPLSLLAGSSVLLGENEISVERGARVRAFLTIRDAHGEICQRAFRL